MYRLMECLLLLPKEVGLGQLFTSIFTLDFVHVCLLQGTEERVSNLPEQEEWREKLRVRTHKLHPKAFLIWFSAAST